MILRKLTGTLLGNKSGGKIKKAVAKIGMAAVG